jgi:probable HAF family extracellular repeat protein
MRTINLAAAAGTLAAGAALAFAGPAHAATAYQLTLTNPPALSPDSPFQEAPLFAVNDSGVPVGSAFFPFNDGQDSVATRGLDLQPLTVGSDAKNRNHITTAFGINAGGAAVGYSQATNVASTPSMLGPERPVVWDAGSAVGRALNLFAGQSVEPHAINGLGDVAGFTFPGNGEDTGNPNKTTAFVMDHTGTVTTLPPLVAGQPDKAADINGDGLVVGSSNLGDITHVHATAWRDGVATDLGVLPGGTFSAATKVNSAGTAVGFSGGQAVEFAGGQVTSLFSGKAESINDGGTVVGFTGTNSDNERAIRYQDGQAVDLNTLIAPGSGYTLLAANDVNDAGQIVGVARQDAHPSRQVGFLLTPLG